MKSTKQALRQLESQWRDDARSADFRANHAAIPPDERRLASMQARTRRACAADLERVMQQVGLA